jgi:hypothetical protein
MITLVLFYNNFSSTELFFLKAISLIKSPEIRERKDQHHP